MQDMDKDRISRDNKENWINIGALLLGILTVLRIVAVLFQGGALYSFGIFYLAVFAGIYSIVKNGLWIREAFFSVWVRGFLAFLFNGSQVLGLYYSMPWVEENVAAWEIFLWIFCLLPFTYAAQNLLFSWVAAKSASGKDCKERDSRTTPISGQRGTSQIRWFFAAYAVILAGFLIPFAAYYPAIMAYDVIPQLDQIKVSGYTTHHPLIHTFLLSVSLKIGEALPFVHNADRAGLAVYTVLQMLVVAGCFAYVSAYLRSKGVHRYLCGFFVLCAAIYPTHGMLAVSITKDTIFAALVMVFTVFVWELVTRDVGKPVGRGWMAAYLLVTLLMLLFRNNSIYAWLLYFAAISLWPYFACLIRKMRHRALPEGGAGWRVGSLNRITGVHVAALLLYVLSGVVLAAVLHASNTTYAREMLSVPAQQIARVVMYHGEELTKEDIGRLELVWGKDNLPEYVPAIADRSKRDIPNDGGTLRVLLKEWVSLGLRYPGEYAKAFFIKNKGMWYLEDDSYLNDIYSYAKGYLQITYPSDQQEYMEALVPGYVRHQKLRFLQAFYRYFAGGDAVWKYLAPLSLVMQPAFYCWLLFYYCICCIGLKKGRWLLPAVYLVGLVGTLLLAPCVLVRYLYPVMLGAVVLAVLAGRSLYTI